MSRGKSALRRLSSELGRGFLFLVTCLSLVAVFFIFWFIAKDAIPYLAYEVHRGDILIFGESEQGETDFHSLEDFERFAAEFETSQERMQLHLYRPAKGARRVEQLKKQLVEDLERGRELARQNRLAEQIGTNGGGIQFSALRSDWMGIWETIRKGRLLRNATEAEQRLAELTPENLEEKVEAATRAIRTVDTVGEMENRVYTYVGEKESDPDEGIAYERVSVVPLTDERAQAFFGMERSVLTEHLGFPDDARPLVVSRSKLLDLRRIKQFFFGREWRPDEDPGSFGSAPIFFGSFIVTFGAILIAVPLGVAASVCLSDILPFSVRQYAKPVIEILAAIPSVAYGFFALVVFAPVLEQWGGPFLGVLVWVLGVPLLGLTTVVVSDLAADIMPSAKSAKLVRWISNGWLGALVLYKLLELGRTASAIDVTSGQNVLNVAIILGIMALPTVVSVSEDALQAVGRELREGSYALGATRAETLVKTIIPAAMSGIVAAAILGIMRAIGETMVVWMASGNAAHIPAPWWDIFASIRTLTATIAGDMGEADQVTGAARFHVLFLMALCLLTFSFCLNLASEWVVRLQRKKLGK